MFSNYDQNFVGINLKNEGYKRYLISGTSFSCVQAGIKYTPPTSTNILQKLQS